MNAVTLWIIAGLISWAYVIRFIERKFEWTSILLFLPLCLLFAPLFALLCSMHASGKAFELISAALKGRKPWKEWP